MQELYYKAKDVVYSIDFYRYENDFEKLVPSSWLTIYQNFTCNCERKNFIYNLFHDLRKKTLQTEGIEGLKKLHRKYNIPENLTLDIKIEIL